LVLIDPNHQAALAELLPWTATYSQPGEEPVAYLCRDFTCLPAISAPEELATKMAGPKS
jgi:uncharacterized protein YyaL (SSP411 family)